ncbi:MAG: DUF4331 family protein [Steroidobacteraceae bacterium]|nr:DUF4331 family protein [Steroidobacteraceae bacterium]
MFHIDSGTAVAATTTSLSLRCRFDASGTIACHAGNRDRAAGDASHMPGVTGERKRFRVFADLRDDPFFNNVRGSRAALNVAAAALAGTSKDAGGCPRFDAATSAKIIGEWRHTDGEPGANFLAGWKTAAIVIEIDVAAVNGGGPALGLWVTTETRDTGVTTDRMGRALTGNALLGTFARKEVSDALKERYNRAPQEHWQEFAAELAGNLAIYDGFDGICGNQWLAVQNAAPATRYTQLSRLLADDRLWVNSRSGRCRQYLAAEFDLVGATNDDCGGRTPDYDAVDVFRSLAMRGEISGLSDGVDRDDARTTTDFPFLRAPTSSTGK